MHHALGVEQICVLQMRPQGRVPWHAVPDRPLTLATEMTREGKG